MNQREKDLLLNGHTGLRTKAKTWEGDTDGDFVMMLNDYLNELERKGKSNKKELKKIKEWLREEFELSKDLEDQRLFEKMRRYVYFNDVK